MTDRRDLPPSPHRYVIAFAVGLVAGAALFGIAAAHHLLDATAAATIVVQAPCKPARFVCQPIKAIEVRTAELRYLDAQRYQPVMAQEMLQAYTARSAGRLELLPQTNHECFDEQWITQKFPADTYFARPTS